MPDTEKFPQLTLATWQADGQLPIPLAVASITKEIESGLVKQRRPYQDGARLDDMGRDVIVWTVTVDFFNGITEPGIPSENYYPDYCSALEKSTEIQKTGTLTVGRDGPVRGRIKHLRTVEASEARDMAAVSITFWQDREDGDTSASFKPTAQSALPVLGDDIAQMAQDVGVWGEDVPALSAGTVNLSALLATPDALLEDALGAVSGLLNLAELLEGAFSNFYDEAAPPAGRFGLDPDAAELILMLRRVRDRAADAGAVLRARVPSRVAVRYAYPVSIFQVAADYGQSIEDLVTINTGKIDPGSFYAIPPQTEILIEAA